MVVQSNLPIPKLFFQTVTYLRSTLARNQFWVYLLFSVTPTKIYLKTAAMENSFHSMTVVLDIFEKRDKIAANFLKPR